MSTKSNANTESNYDTHQMLLEAVSFMITDVAHWQTRSGKPVAPNTVISSEDVYHPLANRHGWCIPIRYPNITFMLIQADDCPIYSYQPSLRLELFEGFLSAAHHLAEKLEINAGILIKELFCLKPAPSYSAEEIAAFNPWQCTDLATAAGINMGTARHPLRWSIVHDAVTYLPVPGWSQDTYSEIKILRQICLSQISE